jgi:hypothetical protein
MNIPLNYEYLSKLVLDLIQKNPQFKNELQAFAPEIYADIESYSKNPNCSCRAKVEAHINNNRAPSVNFINNFINNNNLTLDLKDIENKYKITNYSGKVEKIKISEWSAFRDKTINEKAAYRAFSVANIDSEYVNVFFL